MKKIILNVFITLLSFQCFAQFQATSLGNWQDDNLVVNPTFNSRYNDIWGWANDEGQEFAIIGSTEAIHIIDVTEPTNPTEVQRIAGADAGFYLVHRDMKVYKDHLYCVADEGSNSTLQIIDLTGLPDTATQVYNSNEFVVTSHNIFIDTAQARLYILGRSSTTSVLDISDPTAPVHLATYPKPGFPLPYVHDAYIENHIGYMNCAGDGLWVADFTDPDNPIALGSLEDYPGADYNHSGWMAKDGQHYFMCDETHSSPMTVIDVSDPSDLQVAAVFELGRWDDEIPHNPLVKDDLLYVSHYYDGMQVFDVSNPTNPIQAAEYDTYPDENEAWYSGNWGVYPYLPSGNILLSDMQYGLYVVEKLPETITQYLDIKENELEICEGEDVSFEMTVGSGFSDSGVYLSATLPAGAAIEFMPSDTVMPGEMVTVFITGLTEATEEIMLYANDATDSASVSVFTTTIAQPSQIFTPTSPDIDEIISPNDIFLNWPDADNATSYRIEIATDINDFNGSIIFSEETTSSFLANINLDSSSMYFWHAIAINDCQEVMSDLWWFNTESPNATYELNGNKISIFPNPVDDYLFINFDNKLNIKTELEIYTATGQRIIFENNLIGQNNFKLNMNEFTAGVYFLEIKNEEGVFVERVVVE